MTYLEGSEPVDLACEIGMILTVDRTKVLLQFCDLCYRNKILISLKKIMIQCDKNVINLNYDAGIINIQVLFITR